MLLGGRMWMQAELLMSFTDRVADTSILNNKHSDTCIGLNVAVCM